MNTCECSRHTQGSTGRTEVLSSEEISLTGDGCQVSSAEGQGIRKIYIYKKEGESEGRSGKVMCCFLSTHSICSCEIFKPNKLRRQGSVVPSLSPRSSSQKIDFKAAETGPIGLAKNELLALKTEVRLWLMPRETKIRYKLFFLSLKNGYKWTNCAS